MSLDPLTGEMECTFKATTQFRWLARPHFAHRLQQAWVRNDRSETEWRDVPVVYEDSSVTDGVAPASSVAAGTRNGETK